MKNSAYLVLVCALLYLCLPASAQQSTELSPGYYVVVAAFSPDREDLASNYAKKLAKQGLNASYGYNSTRGYYYVYLHYDKALEEALREMKTTRERGDDPFDKAWVRIVGTQLPTQSSTPDRPAVDTVVVAAQGPSPIAKPDITSAPEVATEPSMTEPSMTEPGEVEVTFNEDIVQYEKIDLGNTEVFLSLFNATNNRTIEGKVTVVDPEKSRVIKEVDGNQYLKLPDPRNKSGKLSLVCEAFGYRKVIHEIDYRNPLADTVNGHVGLMGTTVVVYFDLVRYHKGDVGVMYNVFFYNDAALMRPESRIELDELVGLMNENSGYRIRLHGHTNGNYHGRILARSEGQNIFSLTDAKTIVGSAKQLSYARAEVVKEYLVENGIDAGRIELKAWGGKRPLYDKHGVNAKRNVRVEAEIIEE